MPIMTNINTLSTVHFTQWSSLDLYFPALFCPRPARPFFTPSVALYPLKYPHPLHSPKFLPSLDQYICGIVVIIHYLFKFHVLLSSLATINLL